MKKSNFAVAALAVTISGLSFADYEVIIGVQDKGIQFKEVPWELIENKFISWVDVPETDPNYRYDCVNFAPLPEDMRKNIEFDQTANDCKGKQIANVIRQEKNKSTGEIRTVGAEFTDASQEKIVTGLSKTQKAMGTMTDYLYVENPVPGQSGIYSISNGEGGSFPAYVNMTDDGGYWVLIGRWTQLPSNEPKRNFKDVVVRGGKVVTYTNDASGHPVVPKNYKNNSARVLFKSFNSEWVNRYGTWQSFTTYSSSSSLASGIQAKTSIGSKVLYAEAAGWRGQRLEDMSDTFGLWTQVGAGGPCGGSGVAGGNRICPSFSYATAPHFDVTSLKEVYLRANNP